MKDNHKTLKRFLAFLLSFAMVITYMPMSVLAYTGNPGDQTTVTEEVPAESETAEAPAEDEPAPAEETAPAAEVQAEPQTAEPEKAETAKSEEKASDTKTEEKKAEPAESKETAEPEVKLLTKSTELTAEGDGYAVSALVGKDAKVPADTELQVTEIDKDSDDYDKYYEEALKALKDDSEAFKKIKTIKFYDISLEAESQENSVQPEAPVGIKIEYENGVKVDSAEDVKQNLRIVHFGEEETTVLDNDKDNVDATVEKSKMTDTSFDTEGFSIFAVVVIEEEEGVLSIHQDGYEITINYTEEANIPVGTELVVEQITPDQDRYWDLREEAVKKINEGVEWIDTEMTPDPRKGITDAVFFDITLVYNGKEIEPSVPLDVTIKYEEGGVFVPSGEETNVVHFGEKDTEIIEDVNVDYSGTKKDGKVATEYEYQQDSFSPIGTYSTGEYIEISSINQPLRITAPNLRAVDPTISASKEITDPDKDGVYDLTLNVTGSSEQSSSTSVTKTNVVIVTDVSGSMTQNMTYSKYTGEGTTSGEYYGKTGNNYYRVYWRNPGGGYRWQYTYNNRYYDYTGDVYFQETRLAATKTALKELTGALLANNKDEIRDGVDLNDIVEITLIKFAFAQETNSYNGTSTLIRNVNTAAEKAQLNTTIDNLWAGGGTNWESALALAKTEADRYKAAQPDENVAVIFITDGVPTSWGTTNTAGSESASNTHDAWNAADDDARSLIYSNGAATGYTLYNIFAFGTDTQKYNNDNGRTDADYLRALTNYAYSGTGTYANTTLSTAARPYFFNASDTTALQEAFNAIIDSISGNIGFGGVTVDDGVTTGVTSTSVTVDGTVNTDKFKYLIKNGSNILAIAHITGNDATFTINGTDYPATRETVTTDINGTVHTNTVFSVTVGDKTYKMSPASFDDNGKIQWDLAGIGILENGITYELTFEVWPNQFSYDLVADLNNGVKTLEQIKAEVIADQGQDVWDQIEAALVPLGNGKYAIRTNYEQYVDYYTVDSETNEETGETTTTYTEQPRKELGPKDPVNLTSSEMDMRKLWADSLDQTQLDELLWEDFPTNTQPKIIRDEDGVPTGVGYKVRLHVWKAETLQELNKQIEDYADTPTSAEEHDYLAKTLGWNGTEYVWTDSLEVAPGTMIDINTATEMGVDPSKHTQVTYGDKTYLILESGHYYTVTEDNIDGHFELNTIIYHPMLVDGVLSNVTFNADGTVDKIEPMSTVDATNTLKGGINIKKIIDVEDALKEYVNEDEEFTFTIKLFDEDGNPVYTNGDTDGGGALGTRVYRASGTERGTVPPSGEVTIKIKASESIRIVNVPQGTYYTVEEGSLGSSPYEFKQVEWLSQAKNKEGKFEPIDSGTDTENPKTDTLLIHANAENNVTFTNTYTGTGLDGTKTWVDNDNENNNRPAEIIIKLMQGVIDIAGNVVWGENAIATQTVTPDENGNWTYKFTGLPKVAADGSDYVYKILEEAITGYTTEYTDPAYTKNEDGTFTSDVTNTEEKTKIAVTKTWDDNNNQDGKRPSTATVQLYKTVDGTTSLVTGKSATVPQTDGQVVEWTNLPVYEGGKHIQYSVVETLPDNSEYNKSGDGEKLDAVAGDTGTVAIKNSYTPKTTAVKAKKIWVDENNKYQTRPDSITFQLYKTVDGTTSIVADKTLVLNEEKGWEGELTGLPQYEGGKVITYSFKELDGAGNPVEDDGILSIGDSRWTAEYSSDETYVTIVTNTLATTTANFPVKKILSVPEGMTGPEEWEYTITVEAQNGAPAAATMTGTVDQDNDTVTFGNFTYAAAGTYTYKVTESGTVDGVTNDTEATSGKTVTVTVTANADGTLTAKADSTTDDPLTFTNTYNVGETEIVLGASKTLEVESGNNPPDVSGKYTFTLIDAAGETVDTKTNPDGEGTAVNFEAIKYTAPGEYTYTVTESGTVAGVTNGTTSYTVTVTVTDNGDGTLSAAVTSGSQITAFTNTYKVTPTTVSFPVKKILSVPEGLEGPAEWSYTIDVVANGGAPEAETMSGTINQDTADSTISFGDFTYTAPGTYTYKVTETGTVAGVENDAAATTGKTVTVTVVDNGNGTLTATADSTTEEPLTFTNTYDVEPTTAEFPVKKILSVPEGKTGPAEWEYTIDVAANDGAPEAETMTGTVDQDNDTVTFGDFTYTAPGTYTYTVSETGTVAGVTNDKDAAGKTVTVTVVDNGDGTLTATASSTAEEPLTFINSYNVGSITTSFPVKKEMVVPKGLDGPATWSYTIDVAAQDGAPVAETMTGTVNNTKDTVEFGPITFENPGTYTYKVTETGTIPGVTNDAEATTGKTVTITVTDNGDGTMSAEVSSTADDPVTFTNTYSVEPTTAEFPVEKILEVPEGLDGPAEWEYTIDVAAEDGAPEAETMTGTVDQDNETVTFGPIEYTAPGEYTYTVTETGTVAGVENDAAATTGKTVTVTVVDNKDGTLTATADSTTEEPLTFTNTYKVEPTTANFPVKKDLVIPEGVTGPTQWSYVINVAAQNGAPAAAAMSGTINQDTENSTISFGDFTYTAPGTYTYKVTEAGTVKGVTNDAAATTGKTVTVTVVDNGDGTLTATADSTADEPLTFTNTYSVEPTTISFPVEKEMVVPEGLDGPKDWSYTIDVEAVAGAPAATTMTGTVTKAAPSTTFGPFTYTEAGTYTYKVTETGTYAGVMNDATATTGKTVIVTVVDNGDGTLTATANVSETNPVKFVNRYSVEPTTAEFPVVKELVVPEELEGPATWSYTIDVEAQGGAPEAETMSGTVDQDNDTVTFGDFTYTAKGTYTYKVTETGEIAGVTNDAAATTGKTVTVTVVDNGNGTLTATADSTTAKPLTFTNTYGSEPAEVEEFLFKKVESMPPKTESVTFNFELEGPDADTETRTATVTATAAGTYTIDFGEGAFRFTEPGEYTYTLTELSTGLDAGWITEGSPAEFTIVVTDNGEGELVAEVEDQTITNKYETVTKSGEKTWDDSDYVGQPDYERPESIKVILYAETQNDNGGYDTVTTYEKTVTPGDDKKWTYSWTDLPKYNNGKEIRYTVKEEVPAGYEAEYSEDGMSIVNTPVDKTDVIDPVKLKIQKTDAASGGALPGALFEVKDSAGKVVASVTTDAKGEAEITFTYEDDYTMTETAPTGYTSDPGTWTIDVDQSGVDSVKYDDPNKGVWNWFYHLFFGEGTDYEEGTIKISNPPDETEVTPVKVWNDNTDKDGVRPDSVTFGLYKTVGEEGTPAAVKDKDGKNVTVTISKPSGDTVNRWTGETIENLPAYENGQPVTYTFKELDGETALEEGDKLPGKADAEGNATEYTVSYSDDSLTVTNSHQSKPVKEVYEDPEMTIKIDGKVVQPGQEITYKITYTNTTGKAVKATITDKIPQYTEFVSAEDGGTEADGTVTWANIDVADGATVTVSFTVKVSEDVTGETIFNDATIKEGENEYDTNEVSNPTPPKKDVFETLESTTSIDGETVQPGQELVYKITYTNTTGKAVKATITDKIPKYTEFVSAENGGTEADGVVTWADIDVANDESVTVAFTVKVSEDVTGETVFNDAKVKEGKNEYDTNEVSNPTPPKKDVFETPESTTSIDGEVVQPGQEITYKITYTNTTGEDVKATITDNIPKYTEFVSADNGGKEADGVVTWSEISVKNGESVTVTLTVKVSEDVTGETIFNDATVKEGENEYHTGEVSNPTPPKKDVFETMTSETSIDGEVVQPGQELVYKITYTNTTGEDVKATITDKIPQYTEFVSADNGGTEADGTVTWADIDVANDASVTVAFTVKVSEDVTGETIFNDAKVKEGKNEYETNEVSNPTPPKKDVFETPESTTSIDGELVQPEQELTYKITYTNTTGEDVKATITDKIPNFTEFVSAEDGGQESGGTVTWADLEVKNGESVTVSFTVKVSKDVSGEIVVNDAKVRSGENEYTTNEVSNPTPPVKTVFTGGVEVNIDGEKVKPGQELQYNIKYSNSKDEDITVDIKDDIPEYTEFVSADNGGTESGGTVTWTGITVPAGKSVTVSFKVTVDKEISGQDVTNTGIVVNGDNEYETNEVVNPTPRKLIIEKNLPDFVDHETDLDDGAYNYATFAFEITGTYVDENGETKQYKNTIGMDFSRKSDLTQTVTVEGVPRDIEGLTVKEIYSGNYDPDEIQPEVEFDEETGKFKVSFKNTKDNIEYKGGVVNHYDREGFNGSGETASGEVEE